MGPLSMEAPLQFPSRVLCSIEEEDETGSKEEEEVVVSVESPTGFGDIVPFVELGDFGDDPSPICSLPQYLYGLIHSQIGYCKK